MSSKLLLVSSWWSSFRTMLMCLVSGLEFWPANRQRRAIWQQCLVMRRKSLSSLLWRLPSTWSRLQSTCDLSSLRAAATPYPPLCLPVPLTSRQLHFVFLNAGIWLANLTHWRAPYQHERKTCFTVDRHDKWLPIAIITQLLTLRGEFVSASKGRAWWWHCFLSMSTCMNRFETTPSKNKNNHEIHWDTTRAGSIWFQRYSKSGWAKYSNHWQAMCRCLEFD